MKMLRKVLVLPLTFPSDVCSFGCFDSVIGSMWSVTGNMGGSGSLPCCSGGGDGSRVKSFTGSSMGGKCGSTDLTKWYFITHPRAPCFDSFPRPFISRVFFFEVWKYMLGTLTGPKHQCSMIFHVDFHG
jgi:hypothetical protein